MRIQKNWLYEILRGLLLFIGLCGTATAIYTMTQWPALPRVRLDGVVFITIWNIFVVFMLYQYPAVTLTENGVVFRILIRERFFAWNEIQQAGILWRFGRGRYYNDFVLLMPKGKPRHYHDHFFALRNCFSLIHLPHKKDVRSFVVKYYGPLDFNLADGKEEKSIVA